MQRDQTMNQHRVIFEERIDLRFPIAIGAQQAAIDGAHLAQDESSGSLRGFDIARLVQHPPAISHACDHQAVPAGENLVIEPWCSTPSKFDVASARARRVTPSAQVDDR